MRSTWCESPKINFDTNNSSICFSGFNKNIVQELFVNILLDNYNSLSFKIKKNILYDSKHIIRDLIDNTFTVQTFELILFFLSVNL